MKNNVIVFVHIPKTAGSSLRLGIERAKPAHEIVNDYGPEEKTTHPVYGEYFKSSEGIKEFSRHFGRKKVFSFGGYTLLKAGRKVVLSGHFSPKKYIPVFPIGRFVTFFRDPIDRYLSQYNHRFRKNEQISFEEFLENSKFHNVQSRQIGDVNWRKFGFVGTTETYEEDLERFRQFSGINVKYVEDNRHKNELITLTPSQRALAEKVNAKDIALYEQVKKYLENKKKS